MKTDFNDFDFGDSIILDIRYGNNFKDFIFEVDYSGDASRESYQENDIRIIKFINCVHIRVENAPDSKPPLRVHFVEMGDDTELIERCRKGGEIGVGKNKWIKERTVPGDLYHFWVVTGALDCEIVCQDFEVVRQSNSSAHLKEASQIS